MEQKKNNPAEGRLGLPSLTRTKPHAKSTKRNTDYGTSRLGIISDAELKSDEPVWDLSEKQQTPAHHTGAAEPIAVSPALKKAGRQAESAETAEIKHHGSISSKLSKYKIILGRRKIRTILLLAGTPVIALTLLLWICLDDGETAPQVATAMNATRDTTEHKPEIYPTSPTAKETLQHPKSGQAISAATPARSTFREIFKFLAEIKPAPETTAAVPAQAVTSLKPDKPQDADPEPAARKVATITPAPPQLGFRLSGIMRGSDGRIAFINNRSVKVGQTINGAEVVHIGDFSVEVELKGQRYLIGISSPQPEKTPDEDEDEDESSDSDDDEDESETGDEKE